MSREKFEQKRRQEIPGADVVEQEALRFVKSWHRLSALHAFLWYRGVNLGEMDEFQQYSDVLPHFVERHRDPK
jgi:hypothetical protein